MRELTTQQDPRIFLPRGDSGVSLAYPLANERHAWLQVLRGAIRLDDTQLAAGDGVAISEESHVEFTASEPSEVMLFDLD